jgi:hypothetical protein
MAQISFFLSSNDWPVLSFPGAEQRLNACRIKTHNNMVKHGRALVAARRRGPTLGPTIETGHGAEFISVWRCRRVESPAASFEENAHRIANCRGSMRKII